MRASWRFQRLPHLRSRLVHAPIHGGRQTPFRSSGVFHAQSLQNRERDGRPQRGRERRQRSCDIVLRFTQVQPFRRRRRMVRSLGDPVSMFDRRPRPFPEERARCIQGDAVEPRREFGLAFEASDSVDDPHEHVLH
jgi:hypothetical protein